MVWLLMALLGLVFLSSGLFFVAAVSAFSFGLPAFLFFVPLPGWLVISGIALLAVGLTGLAVLEPPSMK